MEPVAAFPTVPKLRICYRDYTALKVQIIYHPSLNQFFADPQIYNTPLVVILCLWRSVSYLHSFIYTPLNGPPMAQPSSGIYFYILCFYSFRGQCLKVFTTHN